MGLQLYNSLTRRQECPFRGHLTSFAGEQEPLGEAGFLVGPSALAEVQADDVL